MKPIGLTQQQQQEKGPIELTMCVEKTLPENVCEEDNNLKRHTGNLPLKDREIKEKIHEEHDDTNR